MKHSSALVFLDSDASESVVHSTIEMASEQVSEGRYLIVVSQSPQDWESHFSIEGITIALTLGAPSDRDHTEFEFFGNGVIRLYSSKIVSNIWQWTIVRRLGLKPYSRVKESSKTMLKRNRIPVSDPVFTRDVANNVWNIKASSFQKECRERFSRLLSWDDEKFLVFTADLKTSEIRNRKPLDLSKSIVPVPHKVPYEWNTEGKLF
jgi:hypothetical protein